MTAPSSKPTVDSLRHIDKWFGTYRDVGFEIVKWGPGKDSATGREHWKWNFYLRIPECQVPAEKWPLFNLQSRPWEGRPGRLRFGDSPLLSKLNFHGSYTFYGKCEESEGRYVRVGGDYGHASDVEYGYPAYLDSVFRDALFCIDQLWDLVPDLKTWDQIRAERDAAREVQP